MVGSPLLIGTRDAESRMARMGLARITVGLAGVSPELGARIFGAPAEHVNQTTRLLARLFAIRNMALGGWAIGLRGASAKDRRRCAQINLAVDAADLAATVPAMLSAGLRRTGAMSTLLAVSAVLGWLEVIAEN